MQGPSSLIKFQPSVKIYQSMREYHQKKPSVGISSQTPPRQQQILDSILPPRDWTDHQNKLHIQYVSHQPASRQDVIQLNNLLQKMLEDRQARTQGICGIREELFSQTFDQLIRQAAIDSPERGLLLMRVRDQRKMTLAAYQTVFQSSVSYGIKKIIETEQQKGTQDQQYEQMLQRKEQLTQKKFRLLCDKDLFEKQIRQRNNFQRERKIQQLKFLKLQQQHMTKFLQSVKNQMI